jgi:hypothetical protein
MRYDAGSANCSIITIDFRPQTGIFEFCVFELVTADALVDASDEVRSRPYHRGSVRFALFDYFTDSEFLPRVNRTRRFRIWKI